MAEIPLRNRKGEVVAVAIVDDADAAWLNQWRWCLTLGRSAGYARRRAGGVEIKMHRQILGLAHGDERQGDHINGDRLDNRRHNLRILSAYENSLHKKSYVGSASRFRGVSRVTDSPKWQARVKTKGRTRYIGIFDTEEAAAEAARLGRLRLLGEIGE